jgi:hypothetical protein
MTMGLMLRAALLIMVGLVVMEMASSGMSNSEQNKVAVGDETADHKIENSQRNKRNVKAGAERAKRYPNVYTTMKVNNKVRTTTTTTTTPTTTTKKPTIKVTKRNLRAISRRTNIKRTKKPETAETMKKLRATIFDTTTTTKATTKKSQMGETMKKLKAKKVTKKPEIGETVKKRKRKEITKMPGITKLGKANSTIKIMKKTKMPKMRKSMKPRATLKGKRMTMKPGKATTMTLGGGRVKRAANVTEGNDPPTTSGASGQECLFLLSLLEVVSIVIKSI